MRQEREAIKKKSKELTVTNLNFQNPNIQTLAYVTCICLAFHHRHATRALRHRWVLYNELVNYITHCVEIYLTVLPNRSEHLKIPHNFKIYRSSKVSFTSFNEAECKLPALFRFLVKSSF